MPLGLRRNGFELVRIGTQPAALLVQCAYLGLNRIQVDWPNAITIQFSQLGSG